MVPSKKFTCQQDLKTKILMRDYAPGSDLDETQIAKSYGISRTPLREVFQVLSGEGYLQLSQNRGARVSDLGFDRLRTLLRTAPLIYATVARLAAENRLDGQVAALREVQAGYLTALAGDDARAAALEDHAFHQLLGEMAANPYLSPALNRLMIDHTRLVLDLYRPNGKKEKKVMKKAAQQRDALIEAIEQRAGDTAADLALQHWELSRERIEAQLKADPLPLSPEATKDAAASV